MTLAAKQDGWRQQKSETAASNAGLVTQSAGVALRHPAKTTHWLRFPALRQKKTPGTLPSGMESSVVFQAQTGLTRLCDRRRTDVLYRSLPIGTAFGPAHALVEPPAPLSRGERANLYNKWRKTENENRTFCPSCLDSRGGSVSDGCRRQRQHHHVQHKRTRDGVQR